MIVRLINKAPKKLELRSIEDYKLVSKVAALQFLRTCAIKYAKASPILSRHLMMRYASGLHEQGTIKSPHKNSSYGCNYCGNIWIAGNCMARMMSKRKLPNSLRVIKKRKSHVSFSKVNHRLAKAIGKFSVRQVFKCGVCKKSSRNDFRIPVCVKGVLPSPEDDSTLARNISNSKKPKKLKKLKNQEQKFKKTRKDVQKINCAKAERKQLSKPKKDLLTKLIRDAKKDGETLWDAKPQKSGQQENKNQKSTLKRILQKDTEDQTNAKGQLLSFLSML